MYHLVKLFRLPLYYDLWPSPERITVAAIVALGTLAIGWIVFTRKADEFAYRI
jgi:ABC-type polysaccharide/polyol phosphate export permease